MAVKRITKKELKEPDKFLVFIESSLNFIKNKKKILSGVLSGIIIIVLAGYGVNFYLKTKEKNAYNTLNNIDKSYKEELNKADYKTAYEKTKPDFEKFFKNFKNTKTFNIAVLEYADVAYNANDYNSAAIFYDKALNFFQHNGMNLKNIILTGLAYSKYQKKEYKGAEDCLNKIIENDSDILKDDALFNLIFLYVKIGDTEKAKKTFEKLSKDYKDSIYTQLANSMI